MPPSQENPIAPRPGSPSACPVCTTRGSAGERAAARHRARDGSGRRGRAIPQRSRSGRVHRTSGGRGTLRHPALRPRSGARRRPGHRPHPAHRGHRREQPRRGPPDDRRGPRPGRCPELRLGPQPRRRLSQRRPGPGGGPVPRIGPPHDPPARPRVLRAPPRGAQRLLHRPGDPLARRAGLPRRQGRLPGRPVHGGIPHLARAERRSDPAADTRGRPPRPGRPGLPRRTGPGGRGRTGVPQARPGRLGLRSLPERPGGGRGGVPGADRRGGRFGGHFEQIVFGILDRNPDSAVRAAFTRTFA